MFATEKSKCIFETKTKISKPILYFSIYNSVHRFYPTVMHAQGFAKGMLKWLNFIQSECSKSKKEEVFMIPEEIFSKTPNYVFRKFFVTKPWENTKCKADFL